MWQQLWPALESIATAIASIIAAVGLIYVGKQLRESKKIARAEFLLRLEELFQEHTEVHTRLRPGGDWADGSKGPSTSEEWVKVERYMGLFERIQVLIDDRIVDLDAVDRFYGYRVLNIVDNPIIRQAKLEGERAKYWKNFIKLQRALEERHRKQ
jgi:hypothetical protein